MWTSVSGVFSYGWSLGLSLIRRMSDKIFDTKSLEEYDGVSFIHKMSDEAGSCEKKNSEQIDNVKEVCLNVDTDHLETSVVYDSYDETSSKSNGASVGQKKIPKTNEHPGKIVFSKSDNRPRQKVSSDVRWNYVGNEKLDRSQTDLSSSKCVTNTDSGVKLEFSHKSPSYTEKIPNLNSSESDLFPSRSYMSCNPSDLYSTKPHPLFKSSSSSQLPFYKGNSLQLNRQWKYGGCVPSRPISVLPVQQSYKTNTFYSSPQNTSLRSTCPCTESCGKKNYRAESVLSLSEEAETPEGLSWRRLHMSRAKLKATATTSELLSGFAMVAMVELQINKPTAVPEWLFVLFAVCTTILVSVHIFALMISTYLLPNIDAVSKLHVSSLVTESPHDRMKSFIELAWAFSTILGLFLFLVEIAILCWVKFWDYSFTAAMSATMIIMPVLVLFVAFAIHFYHSLVVIKCKTSVSNMQELENLKKQLDNIYLA